MIPIENEKYFQIIRDAVTHVGRVYSKKGLSEDERSRCMDNFNRVRATLNIPKPLSEGDFRNNLATLNVIREVLSSGSTLPDSSLLVLERFKRNYEALYND